ncbi:MAG: hypothetical protein R3Y60_05865 [bacterium]
MNSNVNIKEILKKNSITTNDFANDFQLSRNTMNTYIDIFENEKKLPKDKYNLIFKKLFLVQLDEFEFKSIYMILKRTVNRDKVNGTFELSIEKTEKIFSLINLLVENEFDIDEYSEYFIKMLITNKRKEPIFYNVAKYFYCINNPIVYDYDDLIDSEKKSFTNYFKVFSLEKLGLLTLNDVNEEMFKTRLHEIKKLKELANMNE